jgi:hypothetical protein
MMTSRAYNAKAADRDAHPSSIRVRFFATMPKETLWLNTAFPEARVSIDTDVKTSSRREGLMRVKEGGMKPRERSLEQSPQEKAAGVDMYPDTEPASQHPLQER